MQCTKCRLHQFRRNEVKGRGTKPADVLFITDGPSSVEDLRGLPLLGSAGRVLDECLKEVSFTWYISQVVRCRPCDSAEGPTRAPLPDEAWACWPHLQKVYEKVQPKKVVLLGEVAQRYCKKAFPSAMCLVHPSYILRGGGLAGATFRSFRRGILEVQDEVQNWI